MNYEASDENVSFVAGVPSPFRWRFRLISDVASDPLSEQVDELIEITRNTIEAFQTVFRPTEIKCSITCDGERRKVRASSDSGVTATDLESALPDPTEVSYDLGSVGIRGRVNVELDDGPHWISRGSERFIRSDWFDRDDLESPTPPENEHPLSISISRTSMFVGQGQVEYTINVVTYSDIWFEKTEIGRANRENLGTCLRQLVDSFDLEGFEFSGEYLSEDGLRQMFPELAVAAEASITWLQRSFDIDVQGSNAVLRATRDDVLNDVVDLSDLKGRVQWFVLESNQVIDTVELRLADGRKVRGHVQSRGKIEWHD